MINPDITLIYQPVLVPGLLCIKGAVLCCCRGWLCLWQIGSPIFNSSLQLGPRVNMIVSTCRVQLQLLFRRAVGARKCVFAALVAFGVRSLALLETPELRQRLVLCSKIRCMEEILYLNPKPYKSYESNSEVIAHTAQRSRGQHRQPSSRPDAMESE